MKKNKFSELSAICYLIKELQKRAIYGIEGLKKYDLVYGKNGTEIRITSNPGRNKYCDSVFVQCDLIVGKNDSISLCDNNVINGGYNLYRLFKNKNDATLYNSLINSPILHEIENKEMLSNLISSGGPYFDPELYNTFPVDII